MTTPTDHVPVAVITGAATGIGLATARRLRELGYALVLAGRSPQPLIDAAQQLTPLGPASAPVLTHPTDVANPDSVASLIKHAITRLARIDVLINNAGLAKVIPIARTTPQDIRQIYDTNALGPAYAIAATWPHFEAQRSGCVINISSKGTADPFPGFFAYAAAKGALNVMIKSCAKEGARLNVRAFAVAPGAVETSMLRAMFSEKSLPPAACLAPDDIASVIIQCITGARDQDNGKAIFVRRATDGSIEQHVE